MFLRRSARDGTGLGKNLKLEWFIVCLLGVLLAGPVGSVVIAGPDGLANTAPPSPDPGFFNVGTIGSLSGVYVRNGWVLTANHVGAAPILLDGLLYQPLPASGVRISNPAPPHPDLYAFKLTERPALPDLALPSGPRVVGQPLILIGNGVDRGAEVDPPWVGSGGTSFEGWNLAVPATQAMRWGTNFVEFIDLDLSDTMSFASVFDDLRGPARNDPEAQAVVGDSGGAAFYWNGSTPELVGILFSRSTITEEQENQPLNLVLYGNATLMVDLDFYLVEIENLIDQPDCDDGLDEDGDGWIDYPADPGCEDAFDDSERDPLLVCDNGLDDDGDGFIDFPEDDGCSDVFDPDEVPEPGFLLSLLAGSLALVGSQRSARRFVHMNESPATPGA